MQPEVDRDEHSWILGEIILNVPVIFWRVFFAYCC